MQKPYWQMEFSSIEQGKQMGILQTKPQPVDRPEELESLHGGGHFFPKSAHRRTADPQGYAERHWAESGNSNDRSRGQMLQIPERFCTAGKETGPGGIRSGKRREEDPGKEGYNTGGICTGPNGSRNLKTPRTGSSPEKRCKRL